MGDRHAKGRAEEHRNEDEDEGFTIPLAEEQLRAHTRDVEQGRVVVRKRVETAPLEESIELAHDEVDVERIAMDREVDEVPDVRQEGKTLIVPVVEEVVVVEKRLRLVEEVRITTRQVVEEATARENLRREVVEVEDEEVSEGDRRD